MHLEKRRRGLLLEAFRSEGEGSSSCKPGGGGEWGVKVRVSTDFTKKTLVYYY